MADNRSELAFALISVFEGCRLTAYQDTGGVFTIGVGHTGPDVHAGMTITADEALALFTEDTAHLQRLTASQTPLRAAALMSFGYNTGSGNLQKALTDPREMLNPVHTTDRHGNVLPGLVARRGLESILAGLGV